MLSAYLGETFSVPSHAAGEFLERGAAVSPSRLATGIGGAARSLERAIWSLAAVLLFDGVASAA